MKKITLLLAVVAAFYLHSRQVFSEDAVHRLVLANDQEVHGGEVERACARFTEDAAVDLQIRGMEGPQNVSGGRDEICALMREEAALFRLLPIRQNTEYSNLSVRRHGFPWRSAEVRYEVQSVAQGLPGISRLVTKGTEELTLVRTLGGVRISRLAAKAKQYSQ